MKTTDIPAVNRILRRHFESHRAPIIELIAVKTNDPFKVLVATILSARTKDETTAEVCRRLFAEVDQPHDFDRFTEPELARLLLPIGFFRTKAKHLKQLPAALDKHFGGRVPDTIEELCQLPGVGRKTANLVMTAAFDKHAVCVDVHVHRICNRLGLIRTKTPLQTEMALRKILPRRYWKTWNRYLVSYGQTVCRPVGPKCGECNLRARCDRVGVPQAETG